MGWTSLLPPVITVVAAVGLKQVLVALFAGVVLGATIVHDGNVGAGFLRALDQYLVNAVADKEAQHPQIILFTLFLGALIALLQKGGGALAVARIVSNYAKTRQSGLLGCYLLCLGLFFDDYTCILVTGSTLRDILLNLNISPEKQTSLIHPLAVALPSIVPISSWVGAELGFILAAYKAAGRDCSDPFVVLVKSIPYRVLPLLVIALPAMTIGMKKEIGQLRRIEHEYFSRGAATPTARQNLSAENEQQDTSSAGAMQPPAGAPIRAVNAVLPLVTLVGGTIIGMVVTGVQSCHKTKKAASVVNIFSEADSMNALLWSSMSSLLLIVLLLVAQKILTLVTPLAAAAAHCAWQAECVEAGMEGVKDIVEALFILLLAWSFGSVITDVDTAGFISQALGDSMPLELMPLIAGVFSMAMSLAIGSTWGTMTIMLPLVLPIAAKLGGDDDLMVQVVGAVFGGSVVGNVASPLGDTTILSSMICKCSITEHVSTQIPYVLIVSIVSILGGWLPAGYGVNIYICNLGCLVVVAAILHIAGGSVEDEEPTIFSKLMHKVGLQKQNLSPTSCNDQLLPITDGDPKDE